MNDRMLQLTARLRELEAQHRLLTDWNNDGYPDHPNDYAYWLRDNARERAAIERELGI